MKKRLLLSLAIPFMLFSCNTSSISMPKNPFSDDKYQRIGMEAEYKNKLSKLEKGELEAIRTIVTNPIDIENPEKDNVGNHVSNYEHKREYRDFKYAYFGKEYSTVSQCSMLSSTETQKRYVNNVRKNATSAKQETQTANAGIIKTNTVTTDYTFDDKYKTTETDIIETYSQTKTVKKDNEELVVTCPTIRKTYVEETDAIKFELTPVTYIKDQYFTSSEEYAFELLGPNAVYGKTKINNKDRYLIREGYSLFPEFSTMMGKTYKAQDNYFYEGLLEKYTIPETKEVSYRFTNFRFYHELLILSKPIPESSVPILYLEKPVLIEYSEDKYSIEYKNLTDRCEENIPTEPTL